MSAEQALEVMFGNMHDQGLYFFKSFFSSIFGGIVTDPAMFVLPIDDHLVHRGHGVFDTAIMAYGHLYQLDDHLKRFFASAEAARITPRYSYAQTRRIILDTAAASQCTNGFLRYWMSAGRGGFSLSGHDCEEGEFYCVCFNGPAPDIDPSVGWTVKTSPVPNKPPAFAQLKSVNYLQNALNLMDAQDARMEAGIFVSEDGTVAEGPNLNVGIITQDNVIKVPPFEGCLAGCTMARILALAPGLARNDELEGIIGIVQAPVTLEEAYTAKEVFLTGGSLPVVGVTHWDGRPIGDGSVGIGALALHQLILNDMKPDNVKGARNDQLTAVPYGVLTGMLEDMA